jgi:hypothetical protein
MGEENVKKEAKDVQVTVSKDQSTVTINGTKIEVYPEGKLVVYTNEAVKVKPLEIGDKMADGMIFAGISPNTGKALYTLPADESGLMTWQEAMDQAKNNDADKNLRVPTFGELSLLFNNRAAIGAFNESASTPAGGYWSSEDLTPHLARHLKFGEKYTYESQFKNHAAALRLVWSEGDMKVKPAAAEELAKVKPAAAEELAVGTKMPDGSIFAGISPDTGKQMFAMPADAGVTMKFNKAAKYATKLNKEKTLGHDDWRIPSKTELNVLFQNKEKGALKGTFNLTGSVSDGYFWTSMPYFDYFAREQRFSDGAQNDYYMGDALSVRCVR